MNAKLTAYALNELPPEERTALEAEMEADPRLRAEAEEMKKFCALLNTEVAGDEKAALTVDQRVQVLRVFTSDSPQLTKPPVRSIWRHPAFLVPTAIAACTTAMLVINLNHERPHPAPTSTELLALEGQAVDAEKARLAASPSEGVRVVMEKKAARPEGMTPAPGMPATPVIVTAGQKEGALGTALERQSSLIASNAPQLSMPALPAAEPAPLPAGGKLQEGNKDLALGANGATLSTTTPVLTYAGTGSITQESREKEALGRDDLLMGAKRPLERFDWGFDSFGMLTGDASSPTGNLAFRESGRASAALPHGSSLDVGPLRVPLLTLNDGEDAALKNGVMEFDHRTAGMTHDDFFSNVPSTTSTDLNGSFGRGFEIAGSGALDVSSASGASSLGSTGSIPLPAGEVSSTLVSGSTLNLSGSIMSSKDVAAGGDLAVVNGSSTLAAAPASGPANGERLNTAGAGGAVIMGGAFRGATVAAGDQPAAPAQPMNVATTGVTSLGDGAAPLQGFGSINPSAAPGAVAATRAPATKAPASQTALGITVAAPAAPAAPSAPAAPVSPPAAAPAAGLPAVASTPAPAPPMAGPAAAPAKPEPLIASNPTSGGRPVDTTFFDRLGDGTKENAGVKMDRARKSDPNMIVDPKPATDKAPSSNLDRSSIAQNSPAPASTTPATGKPADAAARRSGVAINGSGIAITPDSIDGLLATDTLKRAKRLEEAEKENVSKFALAKRGEGETYTRIYENPFQMVAQEPLSTFSIDVDTASYANVRRFLNNGQRPPADAVRLEELINYFPYSYEAPDEGGKPFSVSVDMAEAPWQPLHRLARIALKGREIRQERGAANFVFLVDVSGSMDQPDKLPLVRQSLQMLTEQIQGTDRVAIVTYAGESGVALESTPGSQRSKIQDAIDRLHAGGSTNGASGIRLAYEQAAANFVKNGVNRVILCTDGDFNVGISSPEELEKLIAEKAKSRVFLSVLGYGTGNLKDRTMETLADKGNGNYAYIDSLSEARKVLVEQMNATLVTIAKDVKIQVEFNPAQVAAYRLLGYENRALAKQDFNNDRKDAGEIGAGHTVTALYEIVPASARLLSPDGRPAVDELKYALKPSAAAPSAPEPAGAIDAPAAPAAKPAATASSGETMTVKLRFKQPEGDKSELLEVPVTDKEKKLADSPRDFQFAAGVAGFGMLLRDSQHAGELNWEMVRDLILRGKGEDPQGYRGEFLQLIDKARGLTEAGRQ